MSELLWPYSDKRERDELIMIGLRHPAVDAKVQARQPNVRPGVSPALYRGLMWALGVDLIIGAAVLWVLS